MTDAIHPSNARRLGTAAVLAGLVLAIPATVAAAGSATPGVSQAGIWAQTGHAAVPPPVPVPPHCDNDSCSDDNSAGTDCNDANAPVDECGNHDETGGGPGVADAGAFYQASASSLAYIELPLAGA
ncbi:hypothetical protein [Nocardia stercoris]|uniref:Uncharacterized protein n=1 Tax=Nocardia stercoris TaxID=2483361 RepID=A0A3M2L147_9NOCA|nr:hypothetical protein [Nocardia stercoris]RMI31422.1 hypothetical protein EBN03_18930 [Nocardia stercoris]